MFEKFRQFRETADAPVYDCRENCFLKYYENVSENEFDKWVENMISDEFSVLQKNNMYSNNFVLLQKNELQVSGYFTPCDATLRITASDNKPVPLHKALEYENKCQTTFYCFESDHTLIDCGMCLLVQCSDYSFFVVDSGHYDQYNDNDRIHKFMRERTPQGQKIIIAGWLLTHAHSDHICKFIDFLKYNCDDVIVEGVYSNLLPFEYDEPRWGNEERLLSAKLFRFLDRIDIPKYKIHSGETFYIRNLKFDVLGTHEDIYPKHISDFNDSSCVVMMTAENSRVFIPGDASALSSEQLEKRYGENLKCDVVQVAHHGHSGLSEHAYELLNARLAVFPITRIKFDEEYPRIKANQKLIELADKYYISSDGTVKVPLPFDINTVEQLPDETFEDFEKIKNLWGYAYTDERKQELYRIYLEHGGNLDNEVVPADYCGFHEF
ncbi:MAG: hypothetical protein KBT46_09655 [Ruminococcus sp.]|nr:hypothetical protein [Candidatus Copronaster equi]